MNIIEYLLNQVQEEGGELIQAAAKANRFGLSSPDPRTGITNRQTLVAELNDLKAAVELLDAALVSEGQPSLEGLGDRAAIDTKKAKVIRYAKYSVEAGTLDYAPGSLAHLMKAVS